jgi:hypothetical protein
MSPKDIRLASRLSIEKAAVGAGVSSPTVRIYEAAPEAARADKRALLDAFYMRLAARLTPAPQPPATA